MSLYKRHGSPFWWGKFKLPGRAAIQESSRTRDKSQAQEWHDQRQHTLWRESKLGDKPARTWKEAVIQWRADKAHKTDLRGDVAKFKWLDQHLGNLTLDQITREVVMRIVRLKAAEATNATANHYLALIRAVLRRACFEWEWTDRAPSFTKLPEPQGRVRYLQPAEVEALFREVPEYHKAILLFALSTGLRQGNIRDLQWSQVDLGRRVAWIHGDQAKGRIAIAVPLNETAAAVLKGELGKHKDFVFTYRGKPLYNINTRGWRKALKRAGIADFRWHDLRHTWASWLAMSGVGALQLQALGGWQSGVMVRRYAHLSAEHLAISASKLDILLRGNMPAGSSKAATVNFPLESESSPKPAWILAPRPGLEPGTCGLTEIGTKRKKRA